MIKQNLNFEQTQDQRQEQKIGQRGRGDNSGAPPSRHIWMHRHGPGCSCPDCRRYYVVENREVKERSTRIIPEDKHRTLDCYEYVTSKTINKFKEAYNLEDIER